MALIKCAECKKEISSSAQACPGCGKPIVQKKKTSLLAWCVLIFFAFVLMKACSDALTSTKPATPQQVQAQKKNDANVDAYFKKLKKSQGQFGELGLREFGIDGNLLYFRADLPWRMIGASQKEQFLKTMVGSWKAVTDGNGRVEIQDYRTGQVIAKAGVWGIDIEQ